MKVMYSRSDLLRMTGVPAGRLDHFLNFGLLSGLAPEGKGARREYSLRNLGELVVSEALFTAKFQVREIKDTMTLFSGDDFISIANGESDKVLVVIDDQRATLMHWSEVREGIDRFMARHEHSGSKRAIPVDRPVLPVDKLLILGFRRNERNE